MITEIVKVNGFTGSIQHFGLTIIEACKKPNLIPTSTAMLASATASHPSHCLRHLTVQTKESRSIRMLVRVFDILWSTGCVQKRISVRSSISNVQPSKLKLWWCDIGGHVGVYDCEGMHLGWCLWVITYHRPRAINLFFDVFFWGYFYASSIFCQNCSHIPCHFLSHFEPHFCQQFMFVTDLYICLRQEMKLLGSNDGTAMATCSSHPVRKATSLVSAPSCSQLLCSDGNVIEICWCKMWREDW